MPRASFIRCGWRLAVGCAVLGSLGGCAGGGQSGASASKPPLAGAPVITTLAGTGVAGLNGDGLKPLNTNLYLPQDVTWGADGLLYIVDWNNHRIRRINGGVVETVAGSGELGDAQDGPASQVNFNHPTSVAFDHQGRLLIAAWHNSVVKRLDFSTGLIENLAGTGARAYGGDEGPASKAALNLPSAAAMDSHGNVFISDQANYRIRRLDPNGSIHTAAGTGTPGYAGDGGPAVRAELNSPNGQAAAPAGRLTIDAADRIYIADTSNHCVRVIDTDGSIRTVAGSGTAGYSGDRGPATLAQLNTPSDVAVMSDGTLYIADTMNNVVRMVTPDGMISTFAGNGLHGFAGDGGPAAAAELDRPYGLDVAPDGTVYIADTHNQRIRRVTARLPRDYDPSGSGDPSAVTVIPCTEDVGSICTYAGTGEEGFNGDGLDRLQTALYWPFDIEFAPSGRRYVIDWNNHKVREILADDTFTTVMGSDFVGDGPPDASDLTEPGAAPLSVNLNHPTDVIEFSGGDLLVMAWHNHKIRQLGKATGLVEVLAGRGAGFAGDDGPARSALLNQPPHGTFDDAGNFFFVDQRNQRLRVIYDFAKQRGDGIVSTIVGTGAAGFNGDGPALQTQVNFPAGPNPEPSGGIVWAPGGALYFADTLNQRIRRVDFHSADFKNATVSTIAGSGAGGFNGDGGRAIDAQINRPGDMEIGPDGNLYFADTDNHRVRMIDLTRHTIHTIAGTGEPGYAGDGGPAVAARLWRPFGVAFDPHGDLYIADTFNGRIRKIRRRSPAPTVGPSPPSPPGTRARTGAPPTTTPVPWPARPVQPLVQGLPAALTSIAGTAADDVYAVGADPDDGMGPYMLHYHGGVWRRLSTGASGNLWWISVTPIDGAFYMSGENGLILRYDPSGGAFQQLVMPGRQTIFGIWGSDARNIWAVGGDPARPDTGGVIWHFDGASWAESVALRSLRPQGLPTLYKVWGRHGGDVYAAGRLALVLHFDGFHWTSVDVDINASDPEDLPLFTIHGNDEHVVASGGLVNGVIVESVDTILENRATPGMPQMNGVFLRADGAGAAVGVAGAVALRRAEGWALQRPGVNTTLDFHATWIDPDGGVWAVGGDLSTDLTQGMIAYGGPAVIGNTLLASPPCLPDTSGAPGTVSYTHDIVPLLTRGGCRNLSCHGGSFPTSGYDLRSYVTSFEPGSEAAILHVCELVPGRPDDSYLIEKLGPNPPIGVQMPDGRAPLTGEEVNLLRTWILEGAHNDAPALATPTPMQIQVPTPTSLSCNAEGVICTAAGTGLSQFDGDGNPALQTSFYYPFEIAFDAVDRPLILDFNNLRIRRLDADGRVHTIMGKDFEGAPVDGALAVDTALHHASDIEMDSDGTLYVAGDHVPYVFRVGADNRVTIVAGSGDTGYAGDGGRALLGELTTPFGVLPTGAGGFYVADVDAQVIRYVDPSGEISTVAGTGTRGYAGDGGPAAAAALDGPTRMRLDAAGNFYFCDTNNHAVRRIDTRGTIATVAGTGTPGYSGDGGAATAARFRTPYDLRVAPNGDLYIADTGNSAIRRVDIGGIVSTVAGDGVAGFAGDGGSARLARLNRPSGLIVDGDGSLWIADTFNERVRRVAGVVGVRN